MNTLTSQLNAANRPAIVENNFQLVDTSDAFMEVPSIDAGTGIANVLIGPPVSGAAILGQIWRDSLMAKWRCTLAGTPGTWLQVSPAIVAAQPAGAPANYWILNTTSHYKSQYYDGSAWQNT